MKQDFDESEYNSREVDVYHFKTSSGESFRVIFTGDMTDELLLDMMRNDRAVGAKPVIRAPYASAEFRAVEKEKFINLTQITDLNILNDREVLFDE